MIWLEYHYAATWVCTPWRYTALSTDGTVRTHRNPRRKHPFLWEITLHTWPSFSTLQRAITDISPATVLYSVLTQQYNRHLTEQIGLKTILLWSVSPLHVRTSSTERPELLTYIMQYAQSQHEKLQYQRTNCTLSKWKTVFSQQNFTSFFVKWKLYPERLTEWQRLVNWLYNTMNGTIRWQKRSHYRQSLYAILLHFKYSILNSTVR